MPTKSRRAPRRRARGGDRDAFAILARIALSAIVWIAIRMAGREDARRGRTNT